MRVDVSPSRPARAAILALALAAVVGAPGCNRGPKTYPVEGQVLVGGKPAPRATVTFHPLQETAGPLVRPTAQADEQGRFRLTTFRKDDGAPAGDYKVTVSLYLATRRSPQDDPTPVNYLPERYSQADASGLKASVAPGDNRIEPFQLAGR